MKIIEPKVFLVAESFPDEEGVQQFLDHIQASEFQSDADSGGEEIIEIMGRLCYKSFAPNLNPNVTRIRKGNREYLNNVISQGHLSVLEHASVSFIFSDVSRVFTHELVRHRVGTAISQESGRYVRYNEISTYMPECIKNSETLRTKWESAIQSIEEIQEEIIKDSGIQDIQDFGVKKELTSAFRRILPEGLATSIGWTCNLRELRHVIELRTSPHAEEEIRVVFGKVYHLVKEKFPNVFSDFIEVPDQDARFTWYRSTQSSKKAR